MIMSSFAKGKAPGKLPKGKGGKSGKGGKKPFPFPPKK